MRLFPAVILLAFLFLASNTGNAQTDSIVLKDITWDRQSPAGMTELFIPSNNALLPGFIYRANGAQKHPTLLLLHGFPGNERNLDLAQVVRAHGWNVIYFDYRGSWGSQGKFSFRHCVEDVVNVVAFCKKYQDSLRIDTSNIVLFGHSMGGWVCLKSLQRLPGVKKGFALSTWDIWTDHKDLDKGPAYFVLNSPGSQLLADVNANPNFFRLDKDGKVLSGKQIIMLDEHSGNKALAETLRSANKTYFDYSVWPTDHPFTNRRVALMKKVLQFLDR